MNPKSLISTLLVSILLVLAGHSAEAQLPYRSFVSGTGSDANPCSRAQPCQSLPRGISAASTGGEVYVLDAIDEQGIFAPITVPKSISIIGAGARIGISGRFIISPEAGGQVLIKGLDLNAVAPTNPAIEVTATGGVSLVIDDCTIQNGSSGIYFAPGGTATSNLVVRNSVVSRNAGLGGGSSINNAGILIWPQSTGKAVAVIENVNVNNNVYGIRAFDYSIVTIRNSVASQSFWAGIRSESVAGGPVSVFVEHSQVSHNGGSGVVAVNPAAILRISDVTITNNASGINYVGGGTVCSFGNNSVDGNAGTLLPTCTSPLR